MKTAKVLVVLGMLVAFGVSANLAEAATTQSASVSASIDTILSLDMAILPEINTVTRHPTTIGLQKSRHIAGSG